MTKLKRPDGFVYPHSAFYRFDFDCVSIAINLTSGSKIDTDLVDVSFKGGPRFSFTALKAVKFFESMEEFYKSYNKSLSKIVIDKIGLFESNVQFKYIKDPEKPDNYSLINFEDIENITSVYVIIKNHLNWFNYNQSLSDSYVETVRELGTNPSTKI